MKLAVVVDYKLPTLIFPCKKFKKMNIISASALKDAALESIHSRFDYVIDDKIFF